MAWRYWRHTAEHPLPIGASERAAVGQEVHAGDVLAAGTTYGTPVRISGARRLGVAPVDLERVMRVAIGGEVERKTVIARTGRRFARAVSSPIAGRMIHQRADGDLYVAPIVGRWVVRATLDGDVTRSDDACVTVEGSASALQGVAATGPTRSVSSASRWTRRPTSSSRRGSRFGFATASSSVARARPPNR